MPNKNYSHFSAEDFASDPYFQKWVLENDHMTNLFWEKWLVDNPKKKDEVDLAKRLIDQLAFKEYQSTQDDFDQVWKNIKQGHIEDSVSIRLLKKKWYAVSAAAVLILVSSLFFFVEKDSASPGAIKVADPVTMTNEITTGTDKAILTLANGSEIVLEKGEAYNTHNASSNGKEIVYHKKAANKEVVYNYLTTPRGGQFFVKLSDGTQVWLNSESRLKYPVAFRKNAIRQVELVYGEAYFDVSPSTEQNGTKFKVTNQAQEVEVLGTEFNIKAYKDEPNIYTTLIEGKVVVGIMNRNEVLTPNQQLSLDVENNNTVVLSVDVYREIAWKNGVFSFKNKSLGDIMKVLSRWYEIDVVFEKKALEIVTFNGTLKKKLNIVDIMETISSASDMDYEIKNRTVTLK